MSRVCRACCIAGWRGRFALPGEERIIKEIDERVGARHVVVKKSLMSSRRARHGHVVAAAMASLGLGPGAAQHNRPL